MFCPLCKAEYREGLYRCADCDVALVDSLPDEKGNKADSQETGQELAALLAREEDPVFLTALLSALDEAGIPHREAAIHDHEAALSNPFPSRHRFGPGYEVRVLRSDVQAAKRVLLALEEKAVEAPAYGQKANEPDTAESEDREVPEDWDAGRATAEVWVGEDADLAQFLADTLRENGIGSRTDAQPGRLRVVVHPEDSDRAREIIREVLEGAPPA
jgi:hypothetical protein